MKFRIGTKRGDWFDIRADGAIKRLDMPDMAPSGKWLLLGLSAVHWREFVPLASIDRTWLSSHPLLYKNGNPRWTVRDLDHGTVREWGNTKHHGISTITFLEG